MTRTEAIRIARTRVCVYKFGRQQWCVDSYSEGHRAWWAGRPQSYAAAQRHRRVETISHALELLLPENLPDRWTVIEYAATFRTGTVPEVVKAVSDELQPAESFAV